ncbi:MAG: 23S rRNA (uracil(1939)-C(5))-methyltransferase RlmD [Paludibacteraceae bacterium]|nr:23S rRNA (uracil(1939)-C(5))-methyltransferase RlmD [Paludibacteraceae bacterium]
MAISMKKYPLLEDVTITNVAAEGKAIARVNDVVLFTEYAVPGDVVDVQVTKKKHSFIEGRVVGYKKLSEVRCEAVCEHYGCCGGCKWQILPYDEQIRHKQQQVVDALTRIGHLTLPEISPILGSAKIYHYRNKLEYTFSNRRWIPFGVEREQLTPKELCGVGFHIPGMFDKVLDVKKCYLQDDITNRIRNEVRSYALEHNLEFFDLRSQQGFLRTLMIRNTTTRGLMVLLAFYKEMKEEREALLTHLSNMFPEITSLLYVINSKCNDTITDQEIHLFAGDEAIYEKMEDLRFKIGPKSFYQTNSEQAYELYKVVRRFANLTGKELVYDLYTGTGTIANFVANSSRHVVGIEYVPEAIEDAKVNSEINNIKNTTFFAGDMKDILTDGFISEHGRPEVIITDPPRAGMHEDVVKVILNAAPERIVYVSCNPATQARDLAMLCVDYDITAVQPVDMFPHTHHVENVVQLMRRNEASGL